MKESLYYLFISGLIIGSGPCLGLCAPLMISYTSAHSASPLKSILSYAVFSLFRICGYLLLSTACFSGITAVTEVFSPKYAAVVYLILGGFLTAIGIFTLFSAKSPRGRYCRWLNKKNIRNSAILGILIGLSPCLPLLGIIDYIMLSSRSLSRVLSLTAAFGAGTFLSPLLPLMLISGKISQKSSLNRKFEILIRVSAGSILLFLGLKAILRILSR